MFTIKTSGSLFWIVEAEWFGETRKVFGPAPLFSEHGMIGCLDFIQQHRIDNS